MPYLQGDIEEGCVVGCVVDILYGEGEIGGEGDGGEGEEL